MKRHRHLVKFVKLMSAQPPRCEAATPRRAPRCGGGGASPPRPGLPGARRRVQAGSARRHAQQVLLRGCARRAAGQAGLQFIELSNQAKYQAAFSNMLPYGPSNPKALDLCRRSRSRNLPPPHAGCWNTAGGPAGGGAGDSRLGATGCLWVVRSWSGWYRAPGCPVGTEGRPAAPTKDPCQRSFFMAVGMSNARGHLVATPRRAWDAQTQNATPFRHTGTSAQRHRAAGRRAPAPPSPTSHARNASGTPSDPPTWCRCQPGPPRAPQAPRRLRRCLPRSALRRRHRTPR